MFGWQGYLKEQGWSTYQDQLLNKVREGICDPLDAEKLIGEIGLQMGKQRFDYRCSEKNQVVSAVNHV